MTEKNLRKVIRQLILEKGLHQFHGYGRQGNVAKFGIPGPEFSDDRDASTDSETAEKYIDENQPDELIAYSRGAAVAQELDDDTYQKIKKIRYVAPAAKRGWTKDPVKKAPAGSEMWVSSADGAVPLKQSCAIAVEAGIDDVNVWHPDAQGMIGKERRSNPKKKHHWGSLGYEEHDFAMKYAADNRRPDLRIKSKECIADSELPDWGKGKASKEDVEKQWSYIDSKLTEGDLRKLVRVLLQERQVKCPLKNGKRDYKCEYQKYGGASKKGKKDRAARNQARKVAEREGRVKKGDGKEIDHKKPLSKGGSNAKSNQRVVLRATNRKKGNK